MARTSVFRMRAVVAHLCFEPVVQCFDDHGVSRPIGDAGPVGGWFERQGDRTVVLLEKLESRHLVPVDLRGITIVTSSELVGFGFQVLADETYLAAVRGTVGDHRL